MIRRRKLDQSKMVGDVRVTATKLISGRQITFEAWEAAPEPFRGKYSTIRHFDDGWFGRIGTDPDRSMFEHLDWCTAERVEAVKAAYEIRAQVAYAAILQAYPEAALGVRNAGAIVVRQP